MKMTREIAMDEARELVSDSALWPRVRDFLWDFASQVHPSWLESVETGKLECLKAGEPEDSQTLKLSNSQTLRRFILETLEIGPCFHDFPKNDWSRLLLLDGVTLLEIAKWLGALVCADSLRLVMDGPKVRALKAALPGVYPEVFSFTAYFSGFGFQCKDEEMRGNVDEVESIGYSMLMSMLAALPDALVSRLKFKLPKNLCSSAPPRLKSDECRKVVAKLLKLKFPEAHLLCC